MANTTAGFTPVAQTDVFDPASDMNRVEAFAEGLLTTTAATPSALPSSGNWVGRIMPLANGAVMECTAIPGTWKLVNGQRLLGFGSIPSQVLATAAGTNVLTVTATSSGFDVLIEWDAWAFNGASGADRTISYKILCDGTQVNILPGVNQTVPLSGQPRVRALAYQVKHTPAAGSHTWAIEAIASADTSVYIEAGSLKVTEVTL